jgi:hypothetical protein
MSRAAFEQAIATRNWPEVGRLLDEHPGYMRHLIKGLHETNPARLEKTLLAFQIATKVLDEEKIRDQGRRLMWMLNEESGNYCPNAALALGHIAQVRPDIVQPHVPSLQVHAEDPSESMHTVVRKGLAMVQRALSAKGEESSR